MTGYALQAITFVAIVGSQLTVGGRSGLVGSFVALSIWSYLNGLRNWVPIAAIALAVVPVLDFDWIFAHLRLDRIGDISDIRDLDKFSASRIDQYLKALALILSKPVFGYGLEYIDPVSGIEVNRIHNFWLRIGAQGGIGAILLMLIFVWNAIRGGIQLSQSHCLVPVEIVLARASTAVVVCGVAMSMFEPNALIGSFQTSAMWWAAVGIVSGLFAKAQRNRRLEATPRFI